MVMSQVLPQVDGTCQGAEQCVSRNQCPEYQTLYKTYDDLRAQGLQAAASSFQDILKKKVCHKEETGVCCSEPNLPSPKPSPQCSLSSPSCLPGPPNCGSRATVASVLDIRIVGGQDAELGEFPYTALLGSKSGWFCGGTLINQHYVLTAAHCIGRLTRVRLGEYNVTRVIDQDCDNSICLPEPQDFTVQQADITVHQEYQSIRETKGKGVHNDIALIRLPRPAILNAGVQVVCLPLAIADPQEELGSSRAVVVGWGYTDPDFVGSDEAQLQVPEAVQQSLVLPLVTEARCRSAWATSGSSPPLPTNSQICAGGELGKDSCQVSPICNEIPYIAPISLYPG